MLSVLYMMYVGFSSSIELMLNCFTDLKWILLDFIIWFPSLFLIEYWVAYLSALILPLHLPIFRISFTQQLTLNRILRTFYQMHPSFTSGINNDKKLHVNSCDTQIKVTQMNDMTLFNLSFTKNNLLMNLYLTQHGKQFTFPTVSTNFKLCDTENRHYINNNSILSIIG